MTERNLHLTPRNEALIEKGADSIARQFALSIDDVRRRIREKIAPHPPRQQCVDAVEKVRAELEDALKRTTE